MAAEKTPAELALEAVQGIVASIQTAPARTAARMRVRRAIGMALRPIVGHNYSVRVYATRADRAAGVARVRAVVLGELHELTLTTVKAP